jgi:hypothetical protein
MLGPYFVVRKKTLKRSVPFEIMAKSIDIIAFFRGVSIAGSMRFKRPY